MQKFLCILYVFFIFYFLFFIFNMNNTLRIYPLKDLPPEVIAVAFAKCSRSPEPFDQIAQELTETKSADFHEKWVVNFGHCSIAEHAFFNIAIENVSLVAVECIESNRLASYTEKSSRYQIFNRDRVYVPKIFDLYPHIKQAYLKAADKLFTVYEMSQPYIKAEIAKRYPNTKNLPPAKYDASIKSKWVDICRFLLPNCVLANLGMSANARTWEYAITKMLSHPLEEINEIGQRCKEVATQITPTLVKYADAQKYYIKNEKYIFAKTKQLFTDPPSPLKTDRQLEVKLIDYDNDAENKILAGLLYKYKTISYSQMLAEVKKMSTEEKAQIFKDLLADAETIYHKPPRELEYIYYTFDVLLDQGAYFDLKRNRIMTQTPQILSGNYGYYTPRIFSEVGLEKEYKQAMDYAHQVYQLIYDQFPYEASYITTKATARRFLMKMNLREAFYFIGLRSKKTGHITYRKIAQMCWQHINRVHPNLAKYIKVDLE